MQTKVRYRCESWTTDKAKRQRTDAFELWWRRLLRVLWTARRSNQSILKEIGPEYSLEGLMLKLAEALLLWPPDAKSRLIEKDPDAGKVWRQEKKGMTEDEVVGWHHWLNGHEFKQTLGDSEGQEAWRATVYVITKSQTQHSNWSTSWSIIAHCGFSVHFYNN